MSIDKLIYIVSILFLLYAGGIMIWYALMAFISFRSIRKHITVSDLIDYKKIMASPLAPKVSLIAPAFNESLNIVENVRSLMSLLYNDLEVIIINDGSEDDTLEKLINAYELEKVPSYVPSLVKCKKIKNLYKSRKKSFKHLLVVDKENGGKSDALNAGINVSTGRLITCIDADSVIEPDSLLRMVKPFMSQHSDKIVIASGGVVRIANDCEIKDGKLMKVRLPKKWIARFQVLEYMRAFLLSRIGWSKLNGLLIISGALGMFDKKLVIEAGGYRHNTVGEDMELVVRMRRIMEERNEKYIVGFIPDPLCWTECPSDWATLGRQRNRWTRGTIDSIVIHKKMLFNPRYGKLGLLSMPYWMLYEWFAPIIEVVGIILTIVLAILGLITWQQFLMIFVLVYTFAVMISIIAIFIDQETYRQYRTPRYQLKILLCALAEPFIYHPFLVYQAIRGNIKFYSRNQSWGSMTRKGFSKTAHSNLNGN